MRHLDLFSGYGGFEEGIQDVFPDQWTEGVSPSQRYKCLVNAVTVNVIREICKRLI